jgi:hypothetical protein
MSFDKLKKNSQSAISKLVEAAEKINTKTSYNSDENEYWSPTIDKAGNGFAVIRFLPEGEGEDIPWVRFWDHGFQGPGGRWYIEKSLTSIGLPDPVSESNSVLWNSGLEDDKELARKRKRRLHYVANIEVITDSAKPECEGNVYKFKFGKKIFDKITDAMQPKFEDETPINPFSFWDGANFKLKICQVEGYRNYDRSSFDKPSAHRGGDDAQLKEVYSKLWPLAPLVDPANYKSYAELKAKFLQVIGESDSSAQLTSAEQVQLGESAPAPSVGRETRAPQPEVVDGEDDDEGTSTLNYFAQLVNK